eukprot:1165634-Alexandrium_andersonii.AAC.1
MLGARCSEHDARSTMLGVRCSEYDARSTMIGVRCSEYDARSTMLGTVAKACVDGRPCLSMAILAQGLTCLRHQGLLFARRAPGHWRDG